VPGVGSDEAAIFITVTDATDVVNATDMHYTATMNAVSPRTGPILNFVIDEDLLRDLDDFRFEHRFPSRAAAVKWLLNEALRRRFRPSPDEVRSEKTKP
jgi:hypothetical protein